MSQSLEIHLINLHYGSQVWEHELLLLTFVLEHCKTFIVQLMLCTDKLAVVCILTANLCWLQPSKFTDFLSFTAVYVLIKW